MSFWGERLGNPERDGDYIDPGTGLLVCGACGEPKQTRLEILGTVQTVPCDCRCIREEKEWQRAEQAHRDAQYKAARRRTACFEDDVKKAGFTFAADDQRDSKLSRQVRGYVQRFRQYRQEGRGLLLLGPTGTGKTFYACCIANALIDAGHSAVVTNFAKIANDLQGTFDKAQVHNRLIRADLLVLDDLAAERDTSFMQEIVFQVVEERSAAQKPMVVTSNLSMQEFFHPADMARQRVFSRLKEVCIPLSVTGTDRREDQLRRRAAEDQALLYRAGKQG